MTAMLRLPGHSDYETIATWIADAASCARWAGPKLRYPFSPVELQTMLSSVNGLAGGASYCLADASDACASPLGYAQHWVATPGAVHLGRIIISPLARGKGLGRIFCTLLMAQAIQATNAATMSLRVYRDNAPALALYASLGFVAEEAESSDEILFMRADAAHPID